MAVKNDAFVTGGSTVTVCLIDQLLAEYPENQTPPETDPEPTGEEALCIIMGGSYEAK